jgi:hypothetical protein
VKIFVNALADPCAVSSYLLSGAGSNQRPRNPYIGPPSHARTSNAHRSHRGGIYCSHIRPETYGAKGDGAADDSALDNACLAAAAAGLPLDLGKTYRLAADHTLNSDLSFAEGAQLLTAARMAITVSGTIKAGPTQQIFAGAGTVVAASVPWVSVAWWGAYTAAQTNNDAMSTARAAFGPNRTIYFHPGIYTCKSTTASPYPLEYGTGNVACLDSNGHSHVGYEVYGAVLARDDAHKGTYQLLIRHADDFTVRGLTFQAPAGWSTYTSSEESSGLVLQRYQRYVRGRRLVPVLSPARV